MSTAAPIVLDASALLALLRDEEGADQVAEALLQGAVISSVNWTEVLTRLIDLGGDADAIAAVTLPGAGVGTIRIVAFDDRQAREAARLRTQTKSAGLSLGDRAALALAIVRGVPVLTADRAWQSLRVSAKIDLIR
jgi:ribonuclease VapC